MKHLSLPTLVFFFLIFIGGNVYGQKKNNTDSLPKVYTITHEYGTLALSMDSISRFVFNYAGTELSKSQYFEVANIYSRCFNRIMREGKIDSTVISKPIKK